MIKKYVMLLVLASIIFQKAAVAVESTPSANPASNSASLVEKLNQLKTEIASKAAKIKSEVNKKINNKLVLGEVKTIGQPNNTSLDLLVDTKFGNQKVLINEYTFLQNGFLKSKKNNLMLKDISTGTKLVALGDIDDNNNLNARKIIKVENLYPNQKISGNGTVQNVQTDSVRLNSKDNKITNLKIYKDTKIILRDQQINSTDQIMEGQSVAFVGTSMDTGQIKARILFVNSGVKVMKKSRPIEDRQTATPSSTSLKN